ncbi:hypothetical protein CBER1_11874 [Cercospora berteroae]|uniref:Uncharacterized protein n=1 Tax=Cercospora berteroae TaxID=357750 RepID=A0A2S6C0K1_9PEZI|nr:hypothetical protein CBER1_11874 [Cercospora berteroae]
MPEQTAPSYAPRQKVERENEDNGQEQVHQTAEEEQRSPHLGLRQTEDADDTTQRGSDPAPRVQNQQQVPTADDDLPVAANMPQLNNEDADYPPEMQHLVAPALQHNYECPYAVEPLNDHMHARLQAVAETIRREDEQAWNDCWACGVEISIRRSTAVEKDARIAREMSDQFDYQQSKRESGQ